MKNAVSLWANQRLYLLLEKTASPTNEREGKTQMSLCASNADKQPRDWHEPLSELSSR